MLSYISHILASIFFKILTNILLGYYLQQIRTFFIGPTCPCNIVHQPLVYVSGSAHDWAYACVTEGGEEDRRGEISVLSLLHPGTFELALTAEAQLFPRQSEIKPRTRTKYSPSYSTQNKLKKFISSLATGCVVAMLFLKWICPSAEIFSFSLEHFAHWRKVSDESGTQ